MIVVLYIYLGSIVLTISANAFYNKAYEKELEINGYRYKKENVNIYKKIRIMILNFLASCIPLLNSIFPIYIFCAFEKVLEENFKDDLNNGNIEEIPKEEVTKIIEAIEVDNNLVEDAKVIVYKVEDKEKKEMSREEKLEFLREEYERLTGEEVHNDKAKQRGLGKRRL